LTSKEDNSTGPIFGREELEVACMLILEECWLKLPRRGIKGEACEAFTDNA
jgi:hypothetical protein